MREGPRIACLLVGDLPLRAELRAHPELAGEALVISSGRGARAHVLAVSKVARTLGVQPWTGLAQARSIAPGIVVRVASPVLETATRDTLLDIALSCSPRAELAPPRSGFFAAEGAVFVDASGMDRLFTSETAFASALAARAEAHGLNGVVALTRSRSLSLLVARRIAPEPGATQILQAGHESAYLGPLPIDLLDPEDRLAQALTHLGVHTVHDLLRLPRRGLANRHGRGMLELVKRARGEEPDVPLPGPTSRSIEEGIDLEGAVHQLEPLRFVLRGLISRLFERLEMRGLGCRCLELCFELEGGASDIRHVSSSGPSLDVRIWLRLVMLALEERPPNAPVETLRVGSEGCTLARDQLDLFRPAGPDPAALGRTLGELESLCGEGRVGAPVVADSHRPTAHGVRPFGNPRAIGTAPGARSGPGSAPLAIRALRPPVHAAVQVERGRPAFVRSAITHGSVTTCSGPWRTTGDWWNEKARFAVDHYDVQMEDGTLARLCFDWVRRTWLIDGVYD